MKSRIVASRLPSSLTLLRASQIDRDMREALAACRFENHRTERCIGELVCVYNVPETHDRESISGLDVHREAIALEHIRETACVAGARR